MRRDGSERFSVAGVPLDLDVLSFWRWAYSDLLANTTRGVLAEFIVASALGVAHGYRQAWDAHDLTTPEGLRVEVKASGYWQSWHQGKKSKIQFSIRQARAWDAHTGMYAETPSRCCDVYVFCNLAHETRETLDPSDLSQWDFYVVSREFLDERFGNQKSVALSVLLKAGAKRVGHGELKDAVNAASRR